MSGFAGVFSIFPISSDADIGVSNANSYTHAIDFVGPGTRVINGVTFASGFSLASPGSHNIPNSIGSNNMPAFVTGQTRAILSDFNYGNPNAAVQLDGLIAGNNYETVFYHRNWDGGGFYNRTQIVGADVNGDGIADDSMVFNEEDSVGHLGVGTDPAQPMALSYQFTAGAASARFSFTASNPDTATYHLYALTNEGVGVPPPPPPPQFGVRVGNSTLINTLDYSDSFTGTAAGGASDRPYIAAIQGPGAYHVENNHGNLPSFFNRTQFSIASDGPGLVNGSPLYPGNSTAGSDTGITQTGGTGIDFGIRYGLRDHYTVQADAVQVADRIDVTTGPAQGNIFAAGSLSVFFRGNGSGAASLFNGAVDTTIPGLDTGITGKGQWHNYAVRFDRSNKALEIFVDEQSKGVVDLATFAGGIYQDFANDFVGLGGGFGGDNRLWSDNFQVGGNGGIPQAALVPIPGIFNTGVDDAGVPLGDRVDDPHYNLVDVGTGAGPDATLIADGFPIPPWIANGAKSRWIGPLGDDDSNGPAVDYGWEILFDLTGLDPSTAVIRGLWSTDNKGRDILLNGVSTGNPNDGEFAESAYFEVSAANGDAFVPGLNSLIFYLNNAMPPNPPFDNPTGLRVEMIGFAAIPEPSSLALLATGFAVACGFARRRRR